MLAPEMQPPSSAGSTIYYISHLGAQRHLLSQRAAPSPISEPRSGASQAASSSPSWLKSLNSSSSIEEFDSTRSWILNCLRQVFATERNQPLQR